MSEALTTSDENESAIVTTMLPVAAAAPVLARAFDAVSLMVGALYEYASEASASRKACALCRLMLEKRFDWQGLDSQLGVEEVAMTGSTHGRRLQETREGVSTARAAFRDAPPCAARSTCSPSPGPIPLLRACYADDMYARR